MTLRVPKNKTALGNMEPISITEIEGTDLKEVKFGETPVMSTYLVAFVVGEFEYCEAYSAENVRIRVYTNPGQTEQGEFALGCATKILSFFTEYFDMPYPLPKLDMVAIPDFAAGAVCSLSHTPLSG